MISHPLHDIGPELLEYSLRQMQTLLDDIKSRQDLPPKQVKRLNQFTELVQRYRQIKGFLTHYVNNEAFNGEGGHPEVNIKELLCMELYAETTEDLLYALSTAVVDLLRMKPQNDVQARTKAQGLATLVPFYQITHAIYFYFAQTPNYATPG